MNLYEYMGKAIFRSYGIPVPDGYVVEKESDIRPFTKPVAVKSQILLGGRGKSGGIKFAKNENELREAVKALLNSKVRGLTVTKVLVEDMINIDRELYVSIALDRSQRAPVLIASAEGGVEIESVPKEKIFTRRIDPLIGYSDYIGREATAFMGLQGDVASQFRDILSKLYRVFNGEDCELVEINPLVVTKEGKLVAADSKVVVDSDAVYRHKELSVTDPEKTPLELEAQSKGYAFVELDGDIGVIANGAGLTMATLDALTLHKGKPRNFLDLGGTDNVDIVVNAFDLVLKAKPKAILVNIFGGVTKCDTVANGIVAAKQKYGIKQPIVVRLSGVHEDEGREILRKNGIDSYPTMMEAIERVVKLAGGA
ncbi:succinate--CoA ligase [ADP-forming] subunit beta [Thermogymnomonas acidicola]|uniref:Succinate--CoA ligase [ADP-forming] subunit beta n=1 Tax=Thermogymnomonas acidicola TaxID=399579 RepID=A0AA37BSJ0_9ARCH|nr:ADP-forming succinate--CoA ligase subunit beta [Thermogymnomonas acidicola]GGM77753.1 succinate--CoA ligase [ADP-forming] subunit beta [Thermogymnomonas acidicola]